MYMGITSIIFLTLSCPSPQSTGLTQVREIRILKYLVQAVSALRQTEAKLSVPVQAESALRNSDTLPSKGLR
jgi:hypothetical protein